MELKTRPDLDDVKQRWKAFWAGEVSGRPMVCAQAAKDDTANLIDIMTARYWNPCNTQYAEQLDLLDQWAEQTEFMGDLIPHFAPDHGPDQFGAWLGSVLKFSPGTVSTNWAEPVLDDWSSFLPVTLKEENPVWKSVIHYSRMLKERGKGKYLVGMADLHSHMDAFSALRHPDQLCMDLYDCPELVLQGCCEARALYPEYYERLYEAGGMSAETGTIGWLPMWSEGKTAAVQCDFSVFLSNQMWKQFVLPGIETEVEYLDHCFYHMDGIQQLNQLDDLLAIPGLDGIQWVPGAGQPEMFSESWRDVLKKILSSGKKIMVYGEMDLDMVKDIHRDLGCQNLVYDIYGQTRIGINRILKWLEKNT